MKVSTHLDLLNSSKIINLAPPVNPNDGARLADINSAIAGIAWKDSVVVSTQGNINISSPGATIDGISMSNLDRVLVRAQTSTSENGIYVYNGSASPMTRALFANSTDELEQATTTVEEGTNSGVTYRQTQINFTIDTDPILWTQFGSSAGQATEISSGIAEIATQTETDSGLDDTRFITPLKMKVSPYTVSKYSATLGDGSATLFTMTHNIGSFDAICKVYRSTAPYDEILCDIKFTTINTITVEFTSAPTSNEFKIAVIG